MDFRMDKISWVMIGIMIMTIAYFMTVNVTGLDALGYVQVAFFSILAVVAMIAIACIPVLIYCYFVKQIPDIDYSIRTAFAFTIIGIISEIIM